MAVNTFYLKYANDPISRHSCRFCCSIKLRRCNSCSSLSLCCRKAMKMQHTAAPLQEYPFPVILSPLLSFRRMVYCWKCGDSLDMRLKGTERLSKRSFSYILFLWSWRTLSKQISALLCTLQTTQLSLHNRSLVPKSGFECTVISWVDRVRASKFIVPDLENCTVPSYFWARQL